MVEVISQAVQTQLLNNNNNNYTPIQVAVQTLGLILCDETYSENVATN